jgi:ABC-type transporter Mla subunit MlaD
MQIKKNEIRTGILVLVSMSLLILLVVWLGAPGLVKSFKTFHILFDNAAGMKPGAHVLLAGRNIGQVTKLISPVPMKDRPAENKKYEVMIDITVDRDAAIYKEVKITMDQVGVLGERIVDFTQGNENSGLADDGSTFIGGRTPNFSETGTAIVSMVEPVTTETKLTLVELRHALQNLNPMLKNLNGLTGKDGALTQTVLNARDFTDTVKKEPWRLVWKSTKKYSQDQDKDKADNNEENGEMSLESKTELKAKTKNDSEND